MTDDTNALARALLGHNDPFGLTSARSNPFEAPRASSPSLADLATPSDASNPFGSYTNTLTPFLQPSTPSVLGTLPYSPAPRLPVAPPKFAPVPEVKRKVYFAFSFDDVMRVNNVRQTGKIGRRESPNPRQFSDRSMWEKRDIKNEDNLKNLMRRAMEYSSVVCVLIGTETWRSRWVKYEIARSVIDRKGLLAVHLNSIDHHMRKAPDRLGLSPLHMIGIHRDQSGSFYLCERHPAAPAGTTGELGWEWRYYEDFTGAVAKPAYMPAMNVGSVLPLSVAVPEYDMVGNEGFKRIGAWIDAAASAVGR